MTKISEKPYIIDKTPLNCRWIGYIVNAFPEAKIIHIDRNPMAVCWSNYKTLFVDNGLDFSLSQEDMAKYFILYKNFLKQITGTLNRADNRWHGISIDGSLSSDEKFNVLLRPTGKDKRWVKIKTSDAGNMLRTLDVYDTMIGGTLDVEATFDDAVDNNPLTGEAIIRD